MTARSVETSSQELPIVEVLTYPLEHDVFNHMDDNPAFIRRGVGIEVVLRGNDEPVYAKEVWDRGMHLPRPFYEKRLARALDKASIFAGVLSVRYSNSESQVQE